ncbi:calx-beta domain protein [Pedobacter sp. BAL39]|uniref:crotonobetainyl-CoA--carnitine CoA-transferase n=1 Tax=Pedobacter sp. BAL39 TaxID=391596 RepID=UPI00015599AF|nr:crotonobetainyl-CoA--carnitine CoA-transferase [Pedobacter sp. BAL39]EDM37743.1 calx-beta domain protein [Pedobacter sp. BAL39]
MKKITYTLFLVALAINSGFAQLIAPATKPNPAQREMIKRGYGMFIHFGINTFNNIEWSDGTLPLSSYNPTNLDPDQWVQTAKEAGFRYVLLVTKHHDGFCLWDSKYTTYDVASSPVKTDVVKAVSEACKKYGIQFAVYYSLWDRYEPAYKDKDPQKYIDYMKNQLTELFTNYGSIAELWLDGGWDREPSAWGIDQIYGLVKKFNPACAVSVNHTIVNEEGKRDYTQPGNMTVDNKYFFQYFPSDFRLWDPKIITRFDKKQYLHEGKSYYLPFEHTICISKNWNWFEKTQPLPTRDLDELEELFYWSTDNGNCLVMNVPPDQTGRIREYVANTAIALGKRLNLSSNRPLPKNGQFISLNKPVTASSVWEDKNGSFDGKSVNDGNMDSRWAAKDTIASLEIDLNPQEPFNKISIFEYQDTKNLPDGFSQIRIPRIQKYSIDILQHGEWMTIYLGDDPIGDCKVVRFAQDYKTSRLRFRVLKATAAPSIYELSVIRMPEISALR